MRNDARGDVWKVWVYAAAAVLLGAWVSPLLYNAGKALAEVSSNKTTNGFLEWLAGVFRVADFPWFYRWTLALAAILLFFPWMEWVHAGRGGAPDRRGPWQLRLPGGARIDACGQPLRKDPRGAWHGCAGFLLVAGLMLSMGLALVPAGFFTLRAPLGGLAGFALRTLAGALPVAVVMEALFRGVAMGIFLRAMRPAAAVGVSAALFALVLSFAAPPGLNVADPDAAGTGIEMLRLAAGRFADLRSICGNFAPMLALGGVLAYVRWRTASLWMPIGLHTGWLFAKGMLGLLEATDLEPNFAVFPVDLLHQGLVPLLAMGFAGILAHYLTAYRNDESPVHP